MSKPHSFDQSVYNSTYVVQLYSFPLNRHYHLIRIGSRLKVLVIFGRCDRTKSAEIDHEFVGNAC